MNNSELESILKKESLDVLQKIYDYMAEDLSLISEQDKIRLEKINNEIEEKFKILKQEFKILDENKKNNISKVLSEYIDARDYICAYYNEKYFKERSKNRNKTNCRSNKIISKCNLRKTLAFPFKKCVYLIVIHTKKYIYAKSHAFRLLVGVRITPCSCKISPTRVKF